MPILEKVVSEVLVMFIAFSMIKTMTRQMPIKVGDRKHQLVQRVLSGLAALNTRLLHPASLASKGAHSYFSSQKVLFPSPYQMTSNGSHMKTSLSIFMQSIRMVDVIKGWIYVEAGPWSLRDKPKGNNRFFDAGLVGNRPQRTKNPRTPVVPWMHDP